VVVASASRVQGRRQGAAREIEEGLALSEEDLRGELERLRAENEALKSKQERSIRLQVSAKGGASLYGIRRFPITFYKDEWERILGMSDEIRAFLAAHDGELKAKD
jgi:hypothetical protein